MFIDVSKIRIFIEIEMLIIAISREIEEQVKI